MNFNETRAETKDAVNAGESDYQSHLGLHSTIGNALLSSAGGGPSAGLGVP